MFSQQFGFRKSCATNHAVANLTDFVTHKFDNHQSVFGLYLDVNKAFDSIDHNILIDKLLYYDIRDGLQAILLIEDNHYIEYNGTKSILHNISQGVPQGSIVGVYSS